MYGSLLILLLVAGLLLVVYKSLRSKNRLNRELSEQKKQLEEQRDKLEEQRDQLIQLSHQLEEATHAKLVFFTNISHDFRTPLTLVADPVEQLLADRTLTGDQHRMLLLIQRNVNILLRLVNQILDFRKYENGKMEYTPVSVDILSSFEGWNESFQAAARKKHIHFSSIICRIRIIIHKPMWRSWNGFILIFCRTLLSLRRKMEKLPSVCPP